MENQYVLSYFFDDVVDDENTFLLSLEDVYYYGSTTSLMALAYSSIHLWHNSRNLIQNNDPSLFLNVATPSTFNGPGGRVYLTEEGVSGMQLHIGIV